MNFFTGLIIGLIVGWVIEWLIDWFFWRRDDEQIRQKLATCEERVKALEGDLLTRAQTAAVPMPREQDPLEKINGVGPVFAKRLNEAGIYTFAELAGQIPNRIREIISPEEWQKVEPEKWVAEARRIVGLKVDALEKINGVGPVFAKRLNGEGVYTFAELAKLTPDRVREIISPEDWQKIEPDKWVAEAGQMADKPDKV